MKNAPKPIPKAAQSLLREIEHYEWVRARGLRCPDSPERRILKRRGLIESKPPNANPLMRAIGGHARQWLITPLGREMISYLDDA